MSLKDLLDLGARDIRKKGLSEERVLANIDNISETIQYWREYPDLFIDFIKGPESTFRLFFYQRIFLRAVIRHKYVYAVFPRAYSKSFLSIMILMIRCILFPGSKLFIATGGKEQSAGIVAAKVEEICTLIPGFRNEIIPLGSGKSKTSKDSVKYVFKNGSFLENVAASEKTRGGRFLGGLLEECITIDPTILNEVLIPLTNVSRNVNGRFKPSEVINKSQIYINLFGQSVIFS